MKKYRISKYVMTLYLFCVALFLISILICVGPIKRAVFEEDKELFWWSFGSLLAFLVGMACCIKLLFFDYGLGKFSLNAEGITLYIGFKSYPHRWEDFVEYGTFAVNSGGAGNPTVSFWVYCSARRLTQKERDRFLVKTRYDLKNIAFFQYAEEPYQELLRRIPARERERLERSVAVDSTAEPALGAKPRVKGKPREPRGRYPIARNGILFPYIGLIAFAHWEADVLRSWALYESRLLCLSIFLLLLAGIVLCLRSCFFDYFGGTVRMDAEGITIRVGLKRRRRRWEELTDFGVVPVNFATTFGGPMFWVYASRTPLTTEEKLRFKSLRRQLDRLAYFECKPAPFYELLSHLPPAWQEKLRQQVS